MAVLAGLMVAVTASRWFVDRAGEAVALLYVVPIALAGLRFGRRGSLLTTGIGTAAFAGLELTRARGDIDVTGWVAPLLAMTLMGVLVGRLSDSTATNQATVRLQADRLEELDDAWRATARAGDSIVQQVAAARWMLEAGNGPGALAALEATVAEGISELSSSLSPFTPARAPRTP
ncbi:hypothetical protein GHK86_06545 [Acidimicrobiaceae bacterium USS-CC1]|uniref:FUSC family protein n=1 Tax=Acidiferrimicrobium australe TaxID=2664430 RepID=A0ABW9QVH0_9ACTN|nr:hypothetical protein [Acidiferrimicrobium australe]